MTNCPFCNSQVAEIKFRHLDLRICPKCCSTFFPCDQTMAFRGELTDKSRELWLAALLKRNVQDPVFENPKCIDHGEPLVQGKLPDYGFDGYVTSCCKMFHMPPSLTIQLLKRTLEFKFQTPQKEGKHHFFFIRAIAALVDKLVGEKMPEEDPLDLVQYSIHIKPIVDPDEN